MRSIKDIEKLIESDPWRMEILHTVRELGLPDWAIGAGFVRSAVWDAISRKKKRTPLNDVDVLYFNKSDINPFTDKALEIELKTLHPGIPWSVKNQARMHKQNGDKPYFNTENSISQWLEVATCVAARMLPNTSVEILAPHGVEDLFSLRVRPTTRGKQKIDEYRQRLENKKWLETWPNLSIEGLEPNPDLPIEGREA